MQIHPPAGYSYVHRLLRFNIVQLSALSFCPELTESAQPLNPNNFTERPVRKQPAIFRRCSSSNCSIIRHGNAV